MEAKKGLPNKIHKIPTIYCCATTSSVGVQTCTIKQPIHNIRKATKTRVLYCPHSMDSVCYNMYVSLPCLLQTMVKKELGRYPTLSIWQPSCLWMKQNFFPVKIVGKWNGLPANVVEAATIGSFNRRLVNHRRSLARTAKQP